MWRASGALALAAIAALAAPGEAAGVRLERMREANAYERAWLPGQGKLAFLGNGRAGDPVDLYLWDPGAQTLTRGTAYPAVRHSLAVGPDGRVAFVERAATAPPTDPGVPVQAGPESVMIANDQGGPRPVLRGAWVLPGAMAWSPDARRLAFVTRDQVGAPRVAVADPGKPEPPKLAALAGGWKLDGLLGWATPRDVLVRATPRGAAPGAGASLLLLGKDGQRPLGTVADPRLSPDGKHLLDRPPGKPAGLVLRAFGGADRVIAAKASAYAWAPDGQAIYYAVGRDLVATDLAGKETRRWKKVARIAVSDVLPSPEGRWVALEADFGLAALQVKAP